MANRPHSPAAWALWCGCIGLSIALATAVCAQESPSVALLEFLGEWEAPPVAPEQKHADHQYTGHEDSAIDNDDPLWASDLWLRWVEASAEQPDD